jgi:hypothetical protein
VAQWDGQTQKLDNCAGVFGTGVSVDLPVGHEVTLTSPYRYPIHSSDTATLSPQAPGESLAKFRAEHPGTAQLLTPTASCMTHSANDASDCTVLTILVH